MVRQLSNQQPETLILNCAIISNHLNHLSNHILSIDLGLSLKEYPFETFTNIH
jgi:hypothetical protein